MPTTILRFEKKAELSDLRLTWKDDAGVVIDFSVGYTFELKLGSPSKAANLTKTTGITGASTSPNITIVFAANELDNVPSGLTRLQLNAHHTSSGKNRTMSLWLRIRNVVL